MVKQFVEVVIGELCLLTAEVKGIIREKQQTEVTKYGRKTKYYGIKVRVQSIASNCWQRYWERSAECIVIF
jgi:hypothetical protein